jgi:GxxExxY protein
LNERCCSSSRSAERHYGADHWGRDGGSSSDRPGLLESADEACLVYELRERGLRVELQKALPIVYKGIRLDCGYRLDLLVADCVIVEIKAVDKLNSVHDAQLLSYLKLANCHVGLLLNFHCTMLKHGILRLVNNFPSSANSAISAVK